MKSFLSVGLIILLACSFFKSLFAQTSLDRTGMMWSPYLEWSLENHTFTGNPFDLVATVTFIHQVTGDSITTGMFYAGDALWKFRFAGTKAGQWVFHSKSSDAELNGHSGTVTVEANPAPDAEGFVTHNGNHWTRSATGKAFVPQFVMHVGPHGYYDSPELIDQDIQTFIVEHGFSGFHTLVLCRWFNLDEPVSDNIDDPNPDFRTFEALELFITKVYAAGGTVHIWAWGDEQDRTTPVRWGKNGVEDKRLQRYIAARLGPVAGWTMSYGFDLSEWADGEDVREWHTYMQDHLGWPHLLGARSETSPSEPFAQLYEGLDYASYQQERPTYAVYFATFAARPGKPAFSEDRFRIRDRPKDYTMEETRRGLWHSTMAGGVANIWGNLHDGGIGANEGTGRSAPYPNPEYIKTYSEFFKGRFSAELVADSTLSNGVALRYVDGRRYVFYAENADVVSMDLSGMSGDQPAVVVDAVLPYAEVELGDYSPGQQSWVAPYRSDWAIAVGNFNESSSMAPPAITGFTPSNGVVGTPVTLSGSGFTGVTGVSFNGTPATIFNVESDGEIRATVPAGTTSGPIGVTNAAGTATSPTDFTITAGPSITSFIPSSGPGNSVVTLSGSNFTGTTEVSFNGTSAVTFTAISDTEIQATVPDGAMSGPISVSNADGTGTSASNFTVLVPPTISGFSPTSGTVGSNVTVSGSDFTGTSSVSFNGTAATTFSVESGSEILATVPSGATTGAISVTNAAGTGTSATDFAVNGSVEPVTVSFQDGVDGYSGTRDTKLNSGSANTNFGSAFELEVDGGPDRSSLLYWDVTSIPPGNIIQTVDVTLRISNSSNQIYEIYKLGQPWVESEANWNQYVSGQGWQVAGANGSADRDNTVLGTVTGTEGFTTISFDAAGIQVVQSWVDNPQSNYGLIILDYSNTDGLDIYAREHGIPADRPKLTVTYGGNGGPPPAPSLSIDDVVVTEGNSGPVNATFTVRLSGASAQTVTVDYATANGTATAPHDYTALPLSTLSFAAGETSKPIIVQVNGDVFDEADEMFVVNLSNAANAKLAVAQGTGTITDDDAPPAITSFAPSSGGVGTRVTIDGGNFTAVSGVSFNGTPCSSFTPMSDSEIQAVVPLGASTGVISVTTGAGTGTSASVFTVLVPPTISGFSPTSGPVGTEVIVTGLGLDGVTGVSFNGTSAQSLTIDNATQLRVNVPPGASSGSITVINAAGTATSSDVFTVTAPPALSTLTLNPIEDTFTKSTSASKVYGHSDELRVRDSRTMHTFLKFDISGINGPVQSARLRLFVIDPNDDGGSIYRVSNYYDGTTTPWDEDDLVWNNTLTISGTPLSSVGPINLDEVVEFDVTAAISGNGIYSFGIKTATTNTGRYASKETSTPPELIIEQGSSSPVPVISSFTPSSGVEGTTVMIFGNNLSNPAGVFFNGTSASFTEVSNSELRAAVPAGATSGPINVTNGDGTGTSNSAFMVLVPPTISGFIPGSGPVGSEVLITGSGFSSTTSVSFNGTPASSFVVDSDTQLRATVAAGTSTGVISVSNAGGTTSSSGVFTVTFVPSITSFTPSSGPVGEEVVLSGLNFTGTVTVFFNGVPSNSITLVSDNKLRAIVPANATSGPISVSNTDGTGTSASNFTVLVPPNISGFSPTSGPVGTEVIVTGLGFDGVTGVSFNGTSAQSLTIDNAVQLRVNVPPGASSGSITVINPAGAATSSDVFTVTAPPAPSTLTLNPIEDTFTKSTSPDKVYGHSEELRVRDASAIIHTFLKFDVSGISGTIQSVALRLFVASSSDQGGSVYSVSNNYDGTSTPWDEDDLVWNNTLTISGTPISTLGPVESGGYVEFDLTPAITGDGIYSFGITNNTNDATKYTSRETTTPPELVIDMGGAASKLAGIADDTLEASRQTGQGDEVDNQAQIPTEFALGQNYPNPFNPTTAIEFNVPTASEVYLSVYNLRGELVRVLVSGSIPAGRHKTMWDSKNESGISVASGVYVYKLEVSPKASSKKSFVANRRLTLMR